MNPRIGIPLDPGFEPAILFNRQYAQAVREAGGGVPLIVGLERERGRVSRYETRVRAEADQNTLRFVERLMKFLLWSRGGWRIHLAAPAPIAEHIATCYSSAGPRAFDADLMSRVYERPFAVELTNAASVPAPRENAVGLGGHLDGCRIGFDLGASDFKVAAVKDGEVIYTEEFAWNPKGQSDPGYHYQHLNGGLRKAASHLPRVDAIGGSSAGVIVENKVMVASLFRGVPAARFDAAKNIFLRIQAEWRVPLEVANDGDVAALAGAMSLKTAGLLGIALGSSQAAGYIDSQGRMAGWLNELAFAPVDYQPQAPADEWSGDKGVGAQYFSQQAVSRLLPSAGIELSRGLDLPEKLAQVQELMARGDPRAQRIYETIGAWLGYALAHYAEFYSFGTVLVLGRVTTGAGGQLLLNAARAILDSEFAAVSKRIALHVPDEESRRVGQAAAAASLPILRN